MSVNIVNFCKKSYRPNPEKIIVRILENIPEKFLFGLSEIRLVDVRPSNTLRKNWTYKLIPFQHSIIEIYMDDPCISRVPFLSIFLLNMVVLGSMTEHIINYLQPLSKDEEILAYKKPWQINLEWGYFGIWNPLMTILRAGSYLTSRIQKLHKLWLYLANRFIEKHR